MKKSILIITLMFSALFCFSQEQKDAQYQAGKLLKGFSKQYYGGLAIIIGGYAVGTVGLVNGDDGVSTFGGIMALGGAIYQISAFGKIGRAGEKLMISSQQLGMTGQTMNSIGFNISLNRKKHKKYLFASL